MDKQLNAEQQANLELAMSRKSQQLKVKENPVVAASFGIKETLEDQQRIDEASAVVSQRLLEVARKRLSSLPKDVVDAAATARTTDNAYLTKLQEKPKKTIWQKLRDWL